MVFMKQQELRLRATILKMQEIFGVGSSFIAKKIGVNPSLVCRFLKGNYDEVYSERFLNLLEDWCNKAINSFKNEISR